MRAQIGHSDISQPQPTTEAVLSSVIDQALQFTHQGKRHDIIQALESNDDELYANAAMELDRLSEEIQDIVVKDQRFPGESVVMLSRDNNGFSGFYPKYFGDTLIRHGLMNGSTSQAIAWLEKVLSTKETTGKLIFLMWGVQVTEPMQINPDITLRPMSSIGPGPTSRWIEKQYTQRRRESLIPTALNWARPTAVLVMNIKVNCFTQREPLPERKAEDSLNEYRFLHDLFMLLPVGGPCAPILAAHWTMLDDPDLAFASKEGLSQRMHEIFSIQPPSEAEIDIEIVKKSHTGFLALDAGAKSRVRTALKRIIQARLRHSPGDRAVELCTALETLGGDKETNEISHKVATRFARYIGGNIEIRKKNFKLIKAVYTIRSKMVHQGEFDPTKRIDGLTPDVAIEYVNTLATKFIQLVLEQQRFPDWAEFDITDIERPPSSTSDKLTPPPLPPI